MEKARTAAERAERRDEAHVGIVPTQLQDVGAIVRVGERLAGCVPMGRRYSSAEINDWIGGHRSVLASTHYRGSEGTPRPVAAD